MGDPFSWSFSLGRLFGIAIRVNIWFPFFALCIILRVAFQRGPEPPALPNLPGLWLDAAVLMGLLFVAVMLHEFGHCFGARMVDGDAHEILMWPLGGLAAIEVPHTPRANLIAAAAGPGVNLVLCAATALILSYHSYLPPLSPFANQLTPSLHNWSDGRTHYDPKIKESPERVKILADREARADGAAVASEPAWLNWADILVARFFWINWVLLLLNLLPGFPLDGGRMLQAFLWARGDFRQATYSASYAGFIVMIIIIIASMIMNDVFPLLLAWFIWQTCKMQLIMLEHGGEEPLFGYDFSQGYTSLERDQPVAPPPPRKKQPNFFQRWLQRRAQRKQQREQEQREAEERRLDELLEKVQQNGIGALTDEERRFLTRVSSRYKNK